MVLVLPHKPALWQEIHSGPLIYSEAYQKQGKTYKVWKDKATAEVKGRKGKAERDCFHQFGQYPQGQEELWIGEASVRVQT